VFFEQTAWIGERTSRSYHICLSSSSLDRTNFVQDILSRTALEDFLLQIRRDWMGSASLWGHHRELWAENGDALSKIYAGTGALNTSFTRSGKRTLAGMLVNVYAGTNFHLPCSSGVLSDATKSVSRAYINNFQDKGKQVAIDMFLVNFYPVYIQNA
jgi:synaptojanin